MSIIPISNSDFNMQKLLTDTTGKTQIMCVSLFIICIFTVWMLDTLREHQIKSKLYTLEQMLNNTHSQILCANQVLKHKMEELEQKCAELEVYTHHDLVSLATRTEVKGDKLEYDLEGFMEIVDAKLKKLVRAHNDITSSVYTLEDTMKTKFEEMDTHTVLGLRDMEQKLKGIQSEKTDVNILMQKLHQEHQSLFAKYAVLNSKTDELKQNMNNNHVFIGMYLWQGVNVPMFVPQNISSLKEMFNQNITQYWMMHTVIYFQVKLLARTNIKQIDFDDIYVGGGNALVFILDDGSCMDVQCKWFSKNTYEDGDETHIVSWTSINNRDQILNELKRLKTELNKHGIELVLLQCIEDLMK